MFRRRDRSSPGPDTSQSVSPPAAATVAAPPEPIPHEFEQIAAALGHAAERRDTAAFASAAVHDDAAAVDEALLELPRTARRRDDVRALATTTPDDPVLALAGAWCEYWDAIDLRASGRPATSSDGGRAPYLRHVRAADAAAETVVRNHPTFALPWRLLLITGRTMWLTPAELRFRFERFQALAPTSLSAHGEYLQGLTAKWGRPDDGQMVEFVDGVVTAAPDGSPLIALACSKLTELAMASGEAESTFLARHIAEIDAAQARSIEHPAFATNASRHDATEAINHFAFVRTVAGDHTGAQRLLEHLGGRYTNWPWTLTGGPIETISRFRQHAWIGQAAQT